MIFVQRGNLALNLLGSPHMILVNEELFIVNGSGCC